MNDDHANHHHVHSEVAPAANAQVAVSHRGHDHAGMVGAVFMAANTVIVAINAKLLDRAGSQISTAV